MGVERAICVAVARADLLLCAAGRLLAWALLLGGALYGLARSVRG